ncbi:MAG TPA: ATP-binding protein [Pyrinomonadaceae bacterium]|nr:ATP-binding protein [Pyrinomonadaceae bacterium]
MSRYSNRIQFGLSLLTALFLLAALLAIALYAFTPKTPAAQGPILLTAFIALLIGSLICILLVLRWLLRPYRELVGEAERASIVKTMRSSKDEAEFVLETFQSVVGQLQEQREQLEKLSAQARERADSAERFSERIVASVPSGLVAFDGGGQTLVINSPGRNLLQVNGDVQGQRFTALFQELPELAGLVQRCLETGQIFRREEVQTIGGAGATRRLGATIAPLDLSPERGTRGVLCLLTDITEVTQLREQVALKRNLESLGEMSAGLAHEFKNAIATLHGYVQLLQNLELDERANATAASLLDEVRNLSEMVTAFLNFARPQPLQLENVRLNELLTDCIRELKPLFAERSVQLVTRNEKGDGGQTIRADERMLRQALLNLLRNAAEAIPRDRSERRVEVFEYLSRDPRGQAWAGVEINDTGEGIPPEDLQRIFIPFFTTKAKGHGIGLALAHRVITEHGGTLTAETGPNGGAVFTVRLPVQE